MSGSDPDVTKRTALVQSRTFLSALFMGLRTAQIHEASNHAFERAVHTVCDAASELYKTTRGFSIKFAGEQVYLNGAHLRIEPAFLSAVRTLTTIFAARNLGGIELKAPPQVELFGRLLIYLASRDVEHGTDVMQELLAAKIGLLPVQRQVDAGIVDVDRQTLAVRAYAKLILGLREHLDHPQGAATGRRLRIARVVQDVIDLCRDSSDLLLKLAENQSDGPPVEQYAVRTCLVSLLMGHSLGLRREHLVDIGVAALFHVVGIASGTEQLDRDALRASVSRLFLEMPIGPSAYTRAAIVSEHPRPMGDASQSAGSRPPHLFSRIVGVAAAYQQLVTGFGQDAGLRLQPIDALSILRENRAGRFDERLIDLLINVLNAYPVGEWVVLDSGAMVRVHSHEGGSRWDRPVVVFTGHPPTQADLMTRRGARFANTIAGTAAFLGVKVPDHPSDDVPSVVYRQPAEVVDARSIVTPSLIGLLSDLRRQEDGGESEQVITVPVTDVRVKSKNKEDAAPPKMIELPRGTVIGSRYRIVDCIGAGGMGIVYRCDHTMMGIPMAVKVLRPEHSMIPAVAERFLREARAAFQLDHPNIVRVNDFGQEPSGMLFFVMELLEGKSLSDRIAHAPKLSIEESLDITEQMLDAIGHAHAHNIVHRDLKPENMIIVSRGGRPIVKLFDFGIAKVAWDTALSITRGGSFLGTPSYIAPEQASGEAVDARADIYSAGVILYELLTGRLPFTGKNIMSVLMQHAMHPPPPLSLSTGNLFFERTIESTVTRAMAKDPAERFQTPLEMRRSVEAARRAWAEGTPSPEPDVFFVDPVELDEDMGLDTSE